MSLEVQKAADNELIVHYSAERLSFKNTRSSIAQRCLPFHPYTRSIFLLFSPLFSQGCEAFLKEVLPHNLVLALEFETALFSLLKDTRSELLPYLDDPHLLLVPAPRQEDILPHYLSYISELGLTKVVPLSLSAGYKLHAKKYRAFTELLREHLNTHWQNHATALSLGRRWIKNIFSNLSQASGTLKQLHSHIPMFVLGAGSSVENTLSFLQDHGGKFMIIAVDSVLPLLAEASIKPDLIVAQDAQLANVFDLIPFVWKDVALLYDTVSFPSLVRAFPTRAGLCSEFLPISILGRIRETGMHMTRPLGSVGILACGIALQWGQGSIFLAGLDFSTTLEKTHAKMTQPHRSILSTHTRLCPHPSLMAYLSRKKFPAITRKGRRLDTDLPLRNYARVLSQLDNKRLYDTNPDGLPHLRQSIPLTKILQVENMQAKKPDVTIHSQDRTHYWKFLDKELLRLETFLADPTLNTLHSELNYLLIDYPSAAQGQVLDWALISAKDFTTHLKRLRTKRNASPDTKLESA